MQCLTLLVGQLLDGTLVDVKDGISVKRMIPTLMPFWSPRFPLYWPMLCFLAGWAQEGGSIAASWEGRGSEREGQSSQSSRGAQKTLTGNHCASTIWLFFLFDLCFLAQSHFLKAGWWYTEQKLLWWFQTLSRLCSILLMAKGRPPIFWLPGYASALMMPIQAWKELWNL